MLTRTLLLLLCLAQPLLAQPVQHEYVLGQPDLQGNLIPFYPHNSAFKRVGSVAEYITGPGDELKVTVYDGTEVEEQLIRILPDSTISLSILSFVKVGGLTVSEITAKLLTDLTRYIRTPSIQVIVDQHVSKTASVFGSINTQQFSLGVGAGTGPGTYPLTGRTTALDLIFKAGGPAPDARLDQVNLTRAGRTYVLDLRKATQTGDDSHNVLIENGDILRVSGTQQADRRIAILGEVREPGVHNLSSQANVLEAISASRGFTEEASANRIRVIRRTDPRNPTILTVNAEATLRGDLSQNIGLLDGDILVVPRDWLTDLSDLLAQLQPIIAWNGLVTTQPILSVGGYSVNDGGTTTLESSVQEAATSASLQNFTQLQQQAVISQVQQNLRKPTK